MLRIESPFRTADFLGQTPIEVRTRSHAAGRRVSQRSELLTRCRAGESARENVNGTIDGRACLIERPFHLRVNTPVKP
jgi:hypothetical protein